MDKGRAGNVIGFVLAAAVVDYVRFQEYAVDAVWGVF